MNVTLYLPCYNAAQYLDRVLPAALQQTFPPREVVVIDDGSTDCTAEVAGRYSVRVVPHAANRGLGATRNTGIKESNGDFVASLDADVIPHTDWLKNLMGEFTSDEIAGVGGCLIEQNATGMANHWRNTFLRQWHGPNRVENPPFLFGSNTVFRKTALVEAGMYDERHRTNAEDAALSAKLYARRKRLVYTAEAVCYHLREDTFRSILGTAWRWWFYGNFEPITFPLIVRANVANFRRCLRLLRHDVPRCDVSNMLIDMAFPAYGCYRDWNAYIRKKAVRSL